MNKRAKLNPTDDSTEGAPPPPSAVQPEGNLWLLSPADASAAHANRRNGLGRFYVLECVTLLRLLSFVDARELAALCVTSSAFSAYASFEEFWQTACLRRAEKAGFTDFHRQPFSGFFGGSWKRSFFAGQRQSPGETVAPATTFAKVPIYSDLLYQSYDLVHGTNFFGTVLKGPPCLRLARSEVPDVAAFTAEYESGIGRPVLLEGAGSASSDSPAWDEESLRRTQGDKVFHAGGVNFRLKDYFDYARTNNDVQPLYLFDPTFDQTAPDLVKQYEPPVYFRDDLFTLLEENGGKRPDFRWLLIGGARSGQSWHLDPNGTSAWSLTLRGRKRWLFFPPNVQPPGVVDPGDGGECVTPINLAEWAREFYKEACRTPGFCECETNPGDVMYVPRGWWHMVLNVAPMTIAVSQHFISPTGLYNTLKMLREVPHEISGVDRGLAPRRADGVSQEDSEEQAHARRSQAGRAVHDRLMAVLKEKRPDVLAAAEKDLLRLKPKAESVIVPKEPRAEPVQFCFNFDQNFS